MTWNYPNKPLIQLWYWNFIIHVLLVHAKTQGKKRHTGNDWSYLCGCVMSSLTGRSGGCPRCAAGEHPAWCVCVCVKLWFTELLTVGVWKCVCVCVDGGHSWRIRQGWKQEADVQEQQPIPMRLLLWLLQSEWRLAVWHRYQPVREDKKDCVTFLLPASWCNNTNVSKRHIKKLDLY